MLLHFAMAENTLRKIFPLFLCPPMPLLLLGSALLVGEVTRPRRGSTRYRHPANGRAIRRNPAFTSGFNALRAGRGSKFKPARDIPKRKTTPLGWFPFCDCPQILLSHSRTSQGRGGVRGEPLTGSPTRVQSKTAPARSSFCRAKTASRGAREKNHHPSGW